jgi:phosphatidylserine/phosphatidylglycerophosphate/cardiolipin synthase-like enzyme
MRCTPIAQDHSLSGAGANFTPAPVFWEPRHHEASTFLGGLWNQIRILADGCARKAAAVAYLTTEQSVRFNKGDLVIVDASDEVIKAGATSARLLAALRTRGVDLYSLAGLHAKVMVLDQTVVVGSANLTTNSTKLAEAAIITDSPALVASAVALIESLRIHSKTRQVDKASCATAGSTKSRDRISLCRSTIRHRGGWLGTAAR